MRRATPLAERIWYGALSGLTIAGAALVLYLAARSRWTTEQPVMVANWTEVAGGHLLYGQGNAPVVMVVFSDFQCPSCQLMDGWLGQLAHDMGDSLAVYVRPFPLATIHPSATAAAIAAECAGAQGLYDAYHHALFRQQSELGAKPWSSFLDGPPKLEAERLTQCMADSSIMNLVRSDIALGHRTGVRGTPTVVVNGLRLAAVPSYAALRLAVRQVMPQPPVSARATLP